MSLIASTQAAAEYVAVSGSGAMQTLSALARDARAFVSANPLVIVIVVSLGLVFFWMTRPRMH